MGSTICWTKIIFLILFSIVQVKTELTPPYFNLAEGRRIYSSATCGVGTDGPELYCKLVGAVGNESERLIQGQVCDYCDTSIPEKNHPPEYAIDGTENWWQSPPLSRGMKYNEVNLTIDFGQEFHVAYLFIRMGNSPRPGLWTLEKSMDYGKTWMPWQHFSDTPSDCETYFGKDSFKPILRDDDVICTTEYSKIVPLEGGEIPVMLLNNRPSANNYFNSNVLQEWTRATNVRIRLLRTKTLLGHLMSVARADPTVTRRYFYSIKDISIGGRCMCNGHASTCNVLDELSPNRVLACLCQHNTCGIQCSECCPGYEQKKWRQNTRARPFKCEPCNCFGHTNQCIYSDEVDAKGLSLDIHGNYEGGGVCLECQHNTEGINCNKCKPKYYRPYDKKWNQTDVCRSCNCEHFFSTGNCEEGTGRCECRPEYQEPNCDSCSYGYFGYPKCRPCECYLNGTHGYHCEAENGRCPCKINFSGNYCRTCAEGYYDFPNCTECNCNPIGTIEGATCDIESGQCPCKSNFAGKHCDECRNGYYDYPNCLYANCDIHGTVEEICDKKSGSCLCKVGYGGLNCDQCLPGYFDYPDCVPCNCSIAGSVTTTCDAIGKCQCLPNFAGKQCNLCSTGYYKYPDCLPCACNEYGSIGISCNNEGQCSCAPNFDGKVCDKCKELFYNFPACEECNCNPAGVIAKFAGCGSVPAGELCQCKDRVQGRICNECKPLYWNLTISNKYGCEDCDCFIDGTIGSLDTCNSKSGQCHCKPSVEGRSCSNCKDGSFDLYGQSLFGCKDCGCDIGGSLNKVCDKDSGQCKCHPRIAGRTCALPVATHYFPTLYQFQFEYEDGINPTGGLVRYHYDEDVFPNFSKKGYAVFSPLQNEIFNQVDIFKSSVYRMVIRFVNRNNENVIGHILITSENPNEVDQTAKVSFPPTMEPQFVTVSGSKGPSAIVLDPGRYTISIKVEKSSLFLDYFVLLPAAYYEASILTRNVETPCEIGNLDLCRHFKYPLLDQFYPVKKAYNPETNKSAEVLYTDIDHLSVIDEDFLPLINENQLKLRFNITVTRPGRYILVIDYVSELHYPEIYTLRVSIVTGSGNSEEGDVTLYPCIYTTVCRQPVVDIDAKEKSFYLDNEIVNVIEIKGDEVTKAAIKSITAIPYDEWSLDYIQPNSVCVMKNGKCVRGSFRAAPGSKKIEFEFDHEHMISQLPNLDVYDNSTKLILLNNKNSTIQIRTNVSEPGRHFIIIKFYQPNHPQFNVLFKIQTERNVQEGELPVKNCPSNIGCRQLIVLDPITRSFDLNENSTLTLMNKNAKDLWVDFILLVPADEYNNDLLIEERFDQTKEFIHDCGKNHYFVPLNASEFCRKTVFSLTADYNGGALPCNCDYDGSTSFECDPFGGQCQCKSNVIGRRCDACRTGYYGFPDCKPCNCPSTALCEKDSGRCICPPQVEGERCDKCMAYTFGFDQITGCELCNCNPLGVVNRNLQCDLNTGVCDCGRNIIGRTCDRCLNGFFQFPDCRPCRCDIRGTTENICDQDYETCFCKKNVGGQECDSCAGGTYNLQSSNPDGCTKCFCFGKTTTCESAFLRQFNVSLMNSITINSIEITPKYVDIHKWVNIPVDIKINDTTAEVDLSINDKDDFPVYFGVLEYLLDQNNHLAAYGGYLTYSIYYTTGLFGKALILPDVIIAAKNSTFVHQSYEQPANEQYFRGSVHIVESSFTTLSGAPVTRDAFMILLRDLDSIYIRAKYWDQSVISRIYDVQLTIADEDDDNYALYQNLAVEKCQCPPGYKGLSCEDCAPGYYRDPNGPYGGYCIPCQCNGHADTCDCDTGICHECQHSTTGDHCEKCIVGYHGNATNGTPYDCMICACPLPVESNNFATSCEISEDGSKIHCTCRHGYSGEKCQGCAPGFYGQPETVGEVCKPCDCSGNIDPSQPGSCDSVTGECLQCLNNTFGKACNLCSPGYYGDAIRLKDCQSCICDDVGTEHCDSFVGTCHCQPNVIGEKCDRCKKDHYGFESGYGCRPCDCGIASNSTQCHDNTGDCRCKPGVTGRQCDRCQNGYWNYTSEGCIPCSCNTGYSRGFGCSPQTGQCECLPGVIGEKCDRCPYRWVLIPDQGCDECDVCHHALLDVTDSLTTQIEPVILDFQTIAGGYFTSQKLQYYYDLVKNIEPRVKLLSPENVNLTPLNQEIESLEMDIKNQNRKSLYSNQNAKDLSSGSDKILEEANEFIDVGHLVGSTVKSTIKEVKKLSDSFTAAESSTVVENALNEAQNILDNLNKYQIENNETWTQANRSNAFNDQVQNIKFPISLQEIQLEILKYSIGNFSNKLNDLHLWSIDVNLKVGEALKLNNKNDESPVFSKFDTLANQTKEIKENIINATDLAKRSNALIEPIYANIKLIESTNLLLKDRNNEADTFLPKNYNDLYDLDEIRSAAEKHAQLLNSSRNELEKQLSNITANSGQAVKAANAYSDIVDAVTTARRTITNATFAAGNATELSEGAEDRAAKASVAAAELLGNVRESLRYVREDLQNQLNTSTASVEKIRNLNSYSDDQNTAINLALDQIVRPDSQKSVWEEAKPKAILASEQSKEALDIIKPLIQQLPKDLERARILPKEVDTTNKNLAQAESQIERLKEHTPKIQELIDVIEKKEDELTLRESRFITHFDKLKSQLKEARDLANSIKVGVTFYPNTTLELKPPETLPLLAASNSKVSAYFKTEKPNGFLFYLGNENKSETQDRSKRDDYMALEIENGYPVLTLDLGNGPEKVIGSKQVADGEWHQVIVERVDNNVKLIVREEMADGKEQLYESETVLSDAHPVFNLNNNSRLFVGGYPPDFNIQEGIKYSSFEGQIEDLKIGDEEVGLWNFIDGQDNTEGAVARDKLITQDVPSTGYRFSGNGYVVLESRPYSFKQHSNVQFKFKASRTTQNGLLFYTGRQDHFISVEMKDGGILFQYRLGEHKVELSVNEPFNNDQWHKVEAERYGRKGQLKINDNLIYEDQTPEGTEEKLKISDSLYFGGFPGKHNHSEVTNKNFDGCIDEVFITGTPVDLSHNTKANGVRPGCPQKFSTTISFPPKQFGYLRQPNIVISNHLQFNMKFKTKQELGVLLYITNFNQSVTLGLTIEQGSLVLRSMKDPLSTYPKRYDDGEWHVVSGGHDSQKLWLLVDEKDQFTSESKAIALNIPSGNVFFGGLPRNYAVARGAMSTSAYFTGCISDVTINSNIVNFANATDLQSAVLDNCGRNVLDYDVAKLPVYYPSDNVEKVNAINETVVDNRFNDLENEVVPKQTTPTSIITTVVVSTTTTVAPTTTSTTTTLTTPESITITPSTIITPEPPIVLPETTTVKPSKPTRPKQISKERGVCALPVEPDLGNYDDGYRFGTVLNGRLEYSKLPGKIRRTYDIAFDFKTTEEDGIMFYTSDRQNDFIIVYIEGGRLTHSYSASGGIVTTQSKLSYNNGNWHTLQFGRNKNRATIKVDNADTVSDESGDDSVRPMNIQTAMFVGGVSPSILNEIKLRNLMMDPISFSGCLRNLHLFGKPFSDPSAIYDVLPCTEEIETGYFFGKNGGYIKLRDKFKVGIDMSISLDIKPRTQTAFLLSVHGKNAFLILQLINGTINFTVDNGDGPIVAEFKPDENENFCDGEWRTVTVIKSKYVISIQVNSVSSNPGIGSATSSSTDTSRPLFLGGHPYLAKIRGLTARQPYKGCIRNVKIQDNPEKINPSMTVGHIHTGVCPLN